MSALRVAVVGARRARQGLGPFIARDLVAAGAEVAGLLATTPASCAEALEQCERFAGIRPRAYSELPALLEAERPDAIAICSPHATHAPLLERALERGLHVLCEKPFVWGDDFAAESARLAQSFRERGLVLFENCQWPFVLPAFEALHPGALDAAPRRFQMSLEPAARGRDMLADALPHPLSLLQALVPDTAPRAEEIRVEPTGSGVEIGFAYVTQRDNVSVALDLQPSDAHPRRFRFEIDGLRAERQVDARDYALRLACDARSVPLPDPMAALIGDFVACAAQGSDPRAADRCAEIAARARLLSSLAAAWALASDATHA